MKDGRQVEISQAAPQDAAVRTAMQDQSICLSLGNREALRTALITMRPFVAAP